MWGKLFSSYHALTILSEISSLCTLNLILILESNQPDFFFSKNSLIDRGDIT